VLLNNLYLVIGIVDKHKKIEELTRSSLELSPEERASFLDEACGDDSGLKHSVQEKIDEYEEARQYFAGLSERLGLGGLGDPKFSVFEGQTFNKYEIGELIGQGGMGMVYKATDTQLGRTVALKFLSARFAEDDGANTRFKREAQAAASLNHPNVLTVYDILEYEGLSVIAMEYLDGITLRDVLHNGPLDIDRVIEYATQIAEGLGTAHQSGIVHRDMKPANLMINKGGTIKILDFGLAKLRDSSIVTKEGTLMGTVAYMSPEQATGTEADGRSDIWSLGAIVYEMLTGQLPFPGENYHATLYRVVNEPFIPVTGLRPGIPPALVHVVNKALEKDRERRYASADAFLKDLNQVGKGKDVEKPVVAGPILPQSESLLEMSADLEVVRFLVVDDEPDVELLIRQQFKRKIRAGDWVMEFAENGAVALEIIEEAEEDFHIILTDLNMPIMDGHALLAELAKKERPFKTLVLSAFGDMRNVRSAMNLGAYDFLFKPIDFGDFEKTIDKTIREVQSLRFTQETRKRLWTFEEELAISRRIHEAILPRDLPQNDRVSVYAYTDPAFEINGDFYDFFFVEEDLLGFFIGDVTGRGLPAAMFMSMCRTLLKADAKRGFPPAVCMKALNEFVYPESVEDIFITALYGVIDLNTGHVMYCNAGHNPPLIIRASGETEQINWDGGIGIGLKEHFDFEEKSIELGHGDTLFLFTDGILKASNSNGTLIDLAIVEDALKKKAGEEPSAQIRQVVRQISRFTAGTTPSDDLTMVGLKYF